MSEDDDPLVTVLASSDPALLGVAKSLLEAAGIEYLAKGEGLQDLFGLGRIAFNPIVGVVRMQVAPEDAERARDLLREITDRTDTRL